MWGRAFYIVGMKASILFSEMIQLYIGTRNSHKYEYL